MSEKSPAFQFYPKDYETDDKVKVMTLEQEGAYLRLLCHAWLHGSIPADTPSLAKICRVPTGKMARLWPGVSPCFTPAGDGRLTNPRQEKERAKQVRFKEGRSENGKKGADVRWNEAKQKAPSKKRNGTAIVSPLANDSLPFAVPFATAIPTTDNNLPPAAGDSGPKDATRDATAPKVETWASQAADDWIEHKGGRPPGLMFAALKPLVREHGWDRVRPVLRYYVAATEAKYVRFDKLASAFGEYEANAQGRLPNGRPPKRIPL